jgi:hypothetical protein
VASWRVFGASVIGTSHQQAGRACEDAHCYRILNQVALLAAADGASSAPRAADGSARAVEAALSSLEGSVSVNLPTDRDGWIRVVDRALGDALDALRELATSGKLRELDTTLLFSILAPGWLVAAQVGDGAIVAQVGEQLTSLTRPNHGEYVNETIFLTSEDFQSGVQRHVLSDVQEVRGVALLTDGLEPLALKLPSGEPHGPFFAPLFQLATGQDFSADEIARFLASDRVRQRVDDDRTLLLAVPA